MDLLAFDENAGVAIQYTDKNAGRYDLPAFIALLLLFLYTDEYRGADAQHSEYHH